jgi:hypothetical protein
VSSRCFFSSSLCASRCCALSCRRASRCCSSSSSATGSCPAPRTGSCLKRRRLQRTRPVQRARSAPHAHRCCSRHVLRRRRGLVPRVGGAVARAEGDSAVSLVFTAAAALRPASFAGGSWTRAASPTAWGIFPGGQSPCHCQSMGRLAYGRDSLQDYSSRRAKSSAKPEAATTDSSGVGEAATTYSSGVGTPYCGFAAAEDHVRSQPKAWIFFEMPPSPPRWLLELQHRRPPGHSPQEPR